MRVAIVSVSSDIGTALARHWRAKGHVVAGTFRRQASATRELAEAGVALFQCDLDKSSESDTTIVSFIEAIRPWDILVICPASLEPIANFADCDFGDWASSINTNFVQQMKFIHAFLPSRNLTRPNGPLVICWAGSGTNDAPARFSAYTVSKIAQVKMVELLDAEIPDTRFAILGPGWVRTKIHNETLQAGSRAGQALDRTRQKLEQDSSHWTSMDRVIACCDWVDSCAREVIGGRNISVANDSWENPGLAEALAAEPRMYKLRRFLNDWTSPK